MPFPGMRLVEQTEQKKTEMLRVSLKNTTDCNSQALLITRRPLFSRHCETLSLKTFQSFFQTIFAAFLTIVCKTHR